MAVTKIHPIKTTLNKAIDYICNPDKTDNQILISSYGCSYQTADIEFGFTLSRFTSSPPLNTRRWLCLISSPGKKSVGKTPKDMVSILA